jgi:hypothetical protein
MHCYKFPDKETFRTLAKTEGLLTEDGDLILASHTHSIDEVGIITRGGTYDPETGEVITPAKVLDGWHVNFMGELLKAWDSYLVYPSTPSRVFAGAGCSETSELIYERARNELGQFIPDDPATPDINEAWALTTW